MEGLGSEIWDYNNTFYLNENDTHLDDYLPYSMRLETYIVPIVFGIIFIIGALGNGTLIVIFFRHRSMRNEPNFYIFSLAVGDILVILFCVPFTSTIYTLESWPYGDTICKISEWTKDVSIGVSVFTLTALSAERYCAIVNPLRRRAAGGRLGSKMLTFYIAMCIWLLAVAFSIPSIIFSHVRVETLGFNRTISVCTPFPVSEYISHVGIKYRHVITLFKFFVYYALPLGIIAFFYILMAIQLEASTRNMPGENQGQIPQVRTRKKVAKLVLVFVAIFIICFGPYHIFMLWFHFNPRSWEDFNNAWNAVRIVGFCLSFFNSCINPIALYFISGTFRKYFNNYLFCCCFHEGLNRNRGTTREASSHSMAQFGSAARAPHRQASDAITEPGIEVGYEEDTM